MADVLLKLEEIILKIVEKLTSGKFVFTMVTAIVFYDCATKGKLNEQTITAIIMAVVISYFNRKKEENGLDSMGKK